MSLAGNPNLVDALRAARERGCAVLMVEGAGVVRVSHPNWPHPINVNCRRKDTPRELLKLLRRLPEPAHH